MLFKFEIFTGKSFCEKSQS